MSFFEVGIYNTKTKANIGTLWRSAFQLGAAGIFTIGKRYQQQPSDTPKAMRSIPLRHFETFDDFMNQLPSMSVLIGVETGGVLLSKFTHPEQAIYLLGAEDYGLPEEVLSRCSGIVSLEFVNMPSYNVSIAGSLVLYNRIFG